MISLRFIITCLVLFSLTSCQSSAHKQKLSDDIDKRALTHYKLGVDSLHKGFIPKAFEELLLSNQIKPKEPNTLDAIAYAWRVRGNNQEAKKYYNAAIRAGASSAARNNYGSLLVDIGEYNEAVKQLNIALEDPRYRKQDLAFVNLGDAYLGLNDLEQSVASYKKAQLLSPNWIYPLLQEAAAYAKFERENYAAALYERILTKDPTNQVGLSMLIKLFKVRKDNSLLQIYIHNFIEKTSDNLHKAWAKDELKQLH